MQVLNMLACWIEDPNSEAFKLHIPRIYDYLWLAEDGMKMQVIISCSVLCGPFPST
jgi:cycloartenol synthase